MESSHQISRSTQSRVSEESPGEIDPNGITPGIVIRNYEDLQQARNLTVPVEHVYEPDDEVFDAAMTLMLLHRDDDALRPRPSNPNQIVAPVLPFVRSSVIAQNQQSTQPTLCVVPTPSIQSRPPLTDSYSPFAPNPDQRIPEYTRIGSLPGISWNPEQTIQRHPTVDSSSLIVSKLDPTLKSHLKVDSRPAIAPKPEQTLHSSSTTATDHSAGVPKPNNEIRGRPTTGGLRLPVAPKSKSSISRQLSNGSRAGSTPRPKTAAQRLAAFHARSTGDGSSSRSSSGTYMNTPSPLSTVHTPNESGNLPPLLSLQSMRLNQGPQVPKLLNDLYPQGPSHVSYTNSSQRTALPDLPVPSNESGATSGNSSSTLSDGSRRIKRARTSASPRLPVNITRTQNLPNNPSGPTAIRNFFTMGSSTSMAFQASATPNNPTSFSDSLPAIPTAPARLLPGLSSDLPAAPVYALSAHNDWERVLIHTAKCDYCGKHNTNVMLRCRTCSRQVCPSCLTSGLNPSDPHNTTNTRFLSAADY